MGLTRYEMETIITYNAEEGMAELYTRDKSVMLKLDRLVAEYPDIYKLLKSDDWGKTYRFPKKQISLKKPISEKRLEANRRNAQKMLNKRQNQDMPANE